MAPEPPQQAALGISDPSALTCPGCPGPPLTHRFDVAVRQFPAIWWVAGVAVCSRPATEAVGVAADAEPSLVGVTGRVTVSIPANGPGEVLLPVRGGTEAFAAWADQPISKHTNVLVIDRMSARSVIVTPFP